MSAYMVHPEHLHVLVHAAIAHHHNDSGPLSWPCTSTDTPSPRNGLSAGPGHQYRTADLQSVDAIGQMLLDANAASVNDRYQNEDAYVYSYSRPQHTGWHPLELLLAIRGYTYQACEASGWANSEAYRFIAALERRLIDRLIYSRELETWEITPDLTPDRLLSD